MRLPLRDENDRWGRDRLHDETMIARELQNAGMTRPDALRAAAEHVARVSRRGDRKGRIVSIITRHGDNGGPPLDAPKPEAKETP